MSTFDFYDSRAKEAEAAAECADLDNVRDRELRSAAVFRKLADQVKRVELEREKVDEERRERRAAEAAKAAEVAEEDFLRPPRARRTILFTLNFSRPRP
jgi:hypothetical protein